MSFAFGGFEPLDHLGVIIGCSSLMNSISAETPCLNAVLVSNGTCFFTGTDLGSLSFGRSLSSAIAAQIRVQVLTSAKVNTSAISDHAYHQ